MLINNIGINVVSNLSKFYSRGKVGLKLKVIESESYEIFRLEYYS